MPFTAEQFFEVFRRYNEAVWPLQGFLNGLALMALALAFLPLRHAGRYISIILAFLWAWMAIIYHMIYFSRVNPAAVVFALLFLIQAGLFIWERGIQRRMRFGWPGPARGASAMLLCLYALALYPILSIRLGHDYPMAPTFGLPCPTTIFILGLLFCLSEPFPRFIVMVPLLWAAVGSHAAYLFDLPQDFGLAVAGVAGLVLVCLPQSAGP